MNNTTIPHIGMFHWERATARKKEVLLGIPLLTVCVVLGLDTLQKSDGCRAGCDSRFQREDAQLGEKARTSTSFWAGQLYAAAFCRD